MDRRCGVLLPVASLPSRYGIGCFSKEAYEFVDFLADAGQSYWQILPLGQTGYGDSPYQQRMPIKKTEEHSRISDGIIPNGFPITRCSVP